VCVVCEFNGACEAACSIRAPSVRRQTGATIDRSGAVHAAAAATPAVPARPPDRPGTVLTHCRRDLVAPAKRSERSRLAPRLSTTPCLDEFTHALQVRLTSRLTPPPAAAAASDARACTIKRRVNVYNKASRDMPPSADCSLTGGGDISKVQPPSVCFWKRHRRRPRCRFGHVRLPSSHADQWALLPALGFLLVFYSNHSPNMHRL